MPTPNGGLRVESCDAEGVRRMLGWAAREGWNPGLGDAASFHAADPAGFYFGWLGERPVASISAVKYGQGFGFVGLYIAEPDVRGRGLGLQLWDAALATLRGHCIGLDGVVAQQDNYRKSGFVLAHRNVRYAGRAQARPADAPQCVDLAGVPFEDIAALDRAHFPGERIAFLHAWRAQAHAARGWWEGGRLRGMASVRACRKGYKVGPLVAEAPDIAAALFDALCATLPAGAPVFLDLPEPNRAAQALAEARAMAPSFETARMYAGGDPGLPLDRIYGITSFELG